MSTKHLAGSYPDGYALNGKYLTIVVDRTANVSGQGISSYFHATIDNLGYISGANYGIDLRDGGSVINGSPNQHSAVITGGPGFSYGIYISGAPGSVVNYATIGGIVGLEAGGSVTNGSATDTGAQIGYAYFSMTGTVTNFGTIGGVACNGAGVKLSVNNAGRIERVAGYSEQVVNGYGSSAGAYIGFMYLGNGSSVANFGSIIGLSLAGSTTIANMGTIADMSRLHHSIYCREKSGSVSITNGSDNDTSSTIDGLVSAVVAYYAPISVYNYGIIETARNGTGIDLRAGGLVTNGSDTDTNAIITSISLFVSSGTSELQVVNFGTIGRIDNLGGSCYILNGTSSDRAATICNLELDGSTAVNYGTINAGLTYAGGVSLNSSWMINGSNSDVSALVAGERYGVYLGGSATFDNFGTVSGPAVGVVIFGSSSATLKVELNSHIYGKVVGFTAGDMIDIAGVAAAEASYADGQLTVTNGDGSVVRQIGFSGKFQDSTFNIVSDGAGGSDILLGPSDSDLAGMALGAYAPPSSLFGSNVGKFFFANYDSTFDPNDFFACFYINPVDKQVVVVFRGTNALNVTNLLADLTFVQSSPTQEFLEDVTESSVFLASLEQKYSGFSFSLTGHSLGGAVAQLLGEETGLPTVGFDAPGAGGLFSLSSIQSAMAALQGVSFHDKGANINICMSGDQVSEAGQAIGNAFTVASTLPGFDPNSSFDCITGALLNHSLSAILSQLQAGAPLTPGQPYQDVEPDLVPGAVAVGSIAFTFGAGVAAINDLQETARTLLGLDPGKANEYSVVAAAGAPTFASIFLPDLPGVAQFEVSQFVNGSWSNSVTVTPGGEFDFTAGATGLRFYGEDGSGQSIALPVSNGFFFGVEFAQSGIFNGTLTETFSHETWLGGSGSWSTGSAWSGGAAPGDGDYALIKAKGAYTVSLSSPATVTELTLDASGATLACASTLTLDGLITVERGKLSLQAGGVISGGTVTATGGAMLWKGGALDDVTFEGSLNLTAGNAALFIDDQLVVTGVTGTGSGVITLTGSKSKLTFDGEQSLNNATVSLGAKTAAGAATIYAADPLGTGALLEFGSGLTINQAGAFAVIASASSVASDGVVNAGTILAAIAGGRFTIDPLNFTNSGVIDVSAGDRLNLQPGTFTNLTSGVWTGGSLEVDGASIVELSANQTVTTDATTLILNGAGSTIESLNSVTKAEVAIDSTLATIAAGGVLELLGGRGWTSTATFANAGLLQLGGGTFTVASLVNSGLITGEGVIAGPIANGGSITASGGLLDLQGAQTGAGALTITAGATLQADGAVAGAETASFAGAGATLALSAPQTFAATVAGMVIGDIIDLVGVAATSAVLRSGDRLVITDAGNAVATLQLSGSFKGETFSVASDGHGGSAITLAKRTDQSAAQGLASAAAGFGGTAGWSIGTPQAAGAMSWRESLAMPALLRYA